MIEPEKLFQLSGGHKRRKLALTFGALERDIAGIAEKGHEYSFKNLSRREYTKKLVEILLKDPKLSPAAADEIKILLNSESFDELRLCNCARNHLLALIGSFPAEWDLVIAPHSSYKFAKLILIGLVYDDEPLLSIHISPWCGKVVVIDCILKALD